jgi:hypothetical protein
MRTLSGRVARRDHPAPPAGGMWRKPRVRTWNRRLHYYLGLYFLLFLWLFSLSGLMLNHSKWKISHFWERRQEVTVEREIQRPVAAGDLAMARDLMRQLGVQGEIGETKRDSADTHLEFQVVKPGQTWQVKADFAGGTASVKEIRVNAFGVLDSLHKLTGVRMDQPNLQRDWIWTLVWAVAMDAIAIGWIVLVLTGLYLWYRLPRKHRFGLVALGLGTFCCAFFVLGFAAL